MRESDKPWVATSGTKTARRWFGLVAVVVWVPLACSSDNGHDAATGGTTSSGGTGQAGGNGGSALGGSTASGGSSASGGSGGTGASAAGSGGGIEADAAAGEGGGSVGTGGSRTGTGGASQTDGATGMAGSTNPGGPTYPYILSCFNDAASVSSLVIYTSNDAFNFTLLYNTTYTGPTGFLRDPSIMRHTDGKYYVAFTTPPTLSCCGSEQSFAVGSSSNLRDWTTIAVVPCGVAGTVNTWSPEWFVDTDGSVHLTVTLDLRTYRYEPMDATLTKWGPGRFMGISGTIDTQIVKVGNTYHAIIPNRHGTASSLDGPWTFNNNSPSCKEGPAIVHISGDSWRYYCDDGGNGHEKSSLTTDLFQTFGSLATLPVVGNNISQGTVIRGDTGHPF